MSATFTMFGRQQMLDAYWNPDVFVALANAQICLCLQVPPSNASEDQLVEPDPVNGYARITYAMDSGHWPSSGFAEIYNAFPLVFPTVITADWGLIMGWCILDTVHDLALAVGGFGEPFLGAVGMTPTIETQGITLGLYD
jgi:hypothetical protein